MDILNHGEKVKHRTVYRILNRMGIGRQVAAFQNHRPDVRVVFHQILATTTTSS